MTDEEACAGHPLTRHRIADSAFKQIRQLIIIHKGKHQTTIKSYSHLVTGLNVPGDGCWGDTLLGESADRVEGGKERH